MSHTRKPTCCSHACGSPRRLRLGRALQAALQKGDDTSAEIDKKIKILLDAGVLKSNGAFCFCNPRKSCRTRARDKL